MPTGDAAAQQQQQQHNGVLRVGDFVERDIDGIWFPAKVLAVHQKKSGSGPYKRSSGDGLRRHLAYDLVYLDDNNRESEVPEEDVRAVYDDLTKTKEGLPSMLRGEGTSGAECEGQRGRSSDSSAFFEEEGIEKLGQDRDLHGDNSDDQEGPKVTIHSSHGTFDTEEDGSASAYIINGPETNVAAGSGLRGIRWLRGP